LTEQTVGSSINGRSSVASIIVAFACFTSKRRSAIVAIPIRNTSVGSSTKRCTASASETVLRGGTTNPLTPLDRRIAAAWNVGGGDRSADCENRQKGRYR
jgi:hypothetical protein